MHWIIPQMNPSPTSLKTIIYFHHYMQQHVHSVQCSVTVAAERISHLATSLPLCKEVGHSTELAYHFCVVIKVAAQS